ncbi:hypothetical protein BDW59DRAFT_136946 [Aspergillus cavernicola]|uniref:Secreted protein n=1 Tax=Aspergillus cavernicola TaxID=176166 RepID=A0ABR4J4N7_9EURO
MSNLTCYMIASHSVCLFQLGIFYISISAWGKDTQPSEGKDLQVRQSQRYLISKSRSRNRDPALWVSLKLQRLNIVIAT